MLISTHASRGRSSGGFTLVELLITSSLLVVVVGAVGAVMVSELNSTTNLLRSIGQSEDIARVRSQLQREVGLAARVSTASDDVPQVCSVSSPLVLIGPSDGWRIAYGLRSQGPNSNWLGPNQLLRCGPPYTAQGLNPTGAAISSVLADGLPDNGWIVTLSGDAGAGRGVAIDLTIDNSPGNAAATTSFLAEVDSNRLNTFLDRPGVENESPYNETVDGKDYTHWQADGNPISGTTNRIDLVYFPGPYSDYTISSGCNSSSCTVTGPPNATITNGDGLVFTDREIRLP